jgi:hypothetical protein
VPWILGIRAEFDGLRIDPVPPGTVVSVEAVVG